jgi:hypothetical protein
MGSIEKLYARAAFGRGQSPIQITATDGSRCVDVTP